MEAQVVNGEFIVLKDTVWKLSSRVLLLEGFIKKQFGGVFWKFCEEQVNAIQSGSVGSESPHSVGEDEEGVSDHSPIVTLNSTDIKVLAMPAMIPIHHSQGNSTNSNSNLTIATTNSGGITNTAGGAVIINKTNKPIPPPPPLSCMKVNNSSSSESNNSSYQYKPRNFLPKSLAPKPKLLSAGGGSSCCNNNAGGLSRDKDRDLNDDVGAANSSDSSVDSIRFIKTEPQINQQRKSPAIQLPLKPNIRQQQQASSILKPIAASPTIPHRKPLLHSFRDIDVYKGEGGDSESEEDQDGYSAEGFLAAELVAATLSTPSAEGNNKRMKYSFASSSSSSLNGTTPRQMRPNPCHTRCQNRCHDIWTDGDRMGVFETYWSIPSEEERRDWVAQRIERVDMATKRTEFSNFRTCTFKYYLPHPDNPWVQVCKNFFLATIDEKRSYIEKIAQSVKGETEKLSAKDIPFRRRNQMRGAGGIEYVGWMTGPGDEVQEGEGDPDNPDAEYADAEGIEMDEVAG